MSKFEIAKWEDVITIKNGKNQKKVINPDGKYPIYGSGGIMGRADDYLCEEGTTIIGRKGSINNPIYVSEKFWNVDTAFGLSPKENILDKKYFYYFCTTYNFLKHNKATTLPSLTKADLLKIEFPLPPLSQQKKIANILDAADELRKNDKALIAKYDELTQALFLDMFGDPVSNPKGWEKIKFLDLFSIETGKLDSNCCEINGEYPFFTCAKEVLAINTFSYDKEALLLAGNNAAGVYDVKYFNGKFDAYQRTYILGLDTSISNYSFYKIHLEMKLRDLQNLSIGSSTKYLTMKIFERISFIAPPIELQNQFAERVAVIEEQKALAQKSLERSEELFNSLLQKAFKGEL